MKFRYFVTSDPRALRVAYDAMIKRIAREDKLVSLAKEYGAYAIACTDKGLPYAVVFNGGQVREDFLPPVKGVPVNEQGIELDIFEYRPDLRTTKGDRLHSRFFRIGCDTFNEDAVPQALRASAIVYANGIHRPIKTSVVEYVPGRTVKFSVPTQKGLLLLSDALVCDYGLKERAG